MCQFKRISFFVVILSVLLYADIIRIPTDQLTIQAGINATVDGDTVLVAEDTYYENINFKGKAITVASHFILDQDTSFISKTIIDGNQPSNPDSGSVVSFVSGEDTNSVLCGFTITQGTGTIVIYGYEGRAGGGIFCNNSGACIEFNKILDNSVTHNDGNGGGIGVVSISNVDVIIRENWIKNNTINGISGAFGGGVFVLNASGKLANNVINNNSCISSSGQASGGGVILAGDNPQLPFVIIKDNQISYNSATGVDSPPDFPGAWGGGLQVQSTTAHVLNNRITHNSISGSISAGGAGLSVHTTNRTTIVNSNLLFQNNIIQGTDLGGGGIIIVSGNPMIMNNIISENSAPNGGGIEVIYATNPAIINNTIVDNTATTGGGIYGGSNSIIINNIIWGNEASDESNNIYGNISLYNSIVGDLNWSGIDNACFNVDPEFADEFFNLSAESPGVGMGRQTLSLGGVTYEAPAFDFYGNPRPNGADAYVDVGAVESAFTCNAYPLSSSLSSKFIEVSTGSLGFTADVLNPQQQNISVFGRAYTSEGLIADSTQLFDDGVHNDSNANDGVYGNSLGHFLNEDNFGMSVGILNNNSGHYTIFNDNKKFTTKGPIAIDDFYITGNDTIVNPGDYYIKFELFLRNDGSTDTIRNVTVNPVFLNPCTKKAGLSLPRFNDIAPGEIKKGSRLLGITFADSCSGGAVDFALEIMSDGNVFWTDTFQVVVGLEELIPDVPKNFALHQNYPNPFNPVTMINYQLAMNSDVDLTIYNLLGQKLATLVNKKQPAGKYEIEWDASGFATGVYLYRLSVRDPLRRTGDFTEIRKMVLMK